MVGKKKKAVSLTETASVVSAELEETDSNASALTVGDPEPPKKQFCFKNPNFEAIKGSAVARKTRTWKSLKQIVAAERSLQWTADTALYSSISAPPSFKPAKKYSDLSGLPAPYSDPHTKLRYATAEEYSRIRLLPTDIVSGLLTLRHANSSVQ